MKANTARKIEEQFDEIPTQSPQQLRPHIEQYVADHKSATMALVMKTRQPAGDGNKE